MSSAEKEGLKLLSDNWSGRQQWSGTHETSAPVSTVVNLRSIKFQEPEPSEADISKLLNAAVGPEGFASPVVDDQGQKPQNAQMWEVQFYSEEGREAFVDKMTALRKSEQAVEQNTMIDPAYLTVRKAHAREASLSL